MARDDTKLNYDSQWPVDQLVANDVVSVGTGDTVIYTNSAAFTPFFEIQFQPSGSARWFKCGTNSTNGAFTGLFTVFSYIAANQIHVNTTVAGIARYYVWADKVDY